MRAATSQNRPGIQPVFSSQVPDFRTAFSAIKYNLARKTVRIMELFGVQGRPFESRREGGDKVNEQTPVGWLMEQVSSPFSGKRTDGATDAPESDAYPDADLVIMPEEAEGFAMWGGKKHNTYVKISYGESVFRTHIVSNSDEPTWKNLFRVPFSVSLLLSIPRQRFLELGLDIGYDWS